MQIMYAAHVYGPVASASDFKTALLGFDSRQVPSLFSLCFFPLLYCLVISLNVHFVHSTITGKGKASILLSLRICAKHNRLLMMMLMYVSFL